VLYCRMPDADEPSKVVEQKPVGVLATSSMVEASASPPFVGTGLMACTYNDATSSAQRVL
jgi:hypothetical protein